MPQDRWKPTRIFWGNIVVIRILFPRRYLEAVSPCLFIVGLNKWGPDTVKVMLKP